MRNYIALADHLPQVGISDGHASSTIWTSEELAEFANYLSLGYLADNAELAERFATPEQTRRAAVAEVAHQLWPGETDRHPTHAWVE